MAQYTRATLMRTGDAEVNETNVAHDVHDANVVLAKPDHVSLIEDNFSIDLGDGIYDAEEEAALAANLRNLAKERKETLRSKPATLKRAAREDAYEQSPEPSAKRVRVGNDMLAVERATETNRPEKYSGQSQKHLDEFLRQVNATFRTEPAIYASNADKCIYAGECLAERPQIAWAAMETRIRADPSRPYSWKAFVEMLQDDLRPKAKCEVSLYAKIAATHQRKDQSVGNFFSYLSWLERQLEHEVPDWVGRMWILTKAHPYLIEALKLRGSLGNTRLELEEALRSIEGVVPRPTGITVKENSTVARGDSAPSAVKRTTLTQPRSNAQRFYIARRKPAQAATLSRIDDTSHSIKCFNCNKMGHISKDCKTPRKTRGSDQSFHLPSTDPANSLQENPPTEPLSRDNLVPLLAMILCVHLSSRGQSF
ncbi:hypothetical protein MMC07_006010 [Pseudocyphellaria aurata]|nr:hypothetical protein [Pseudocyphellaria aurata]